MYPLGDSCNCNVWITSVLRRSLIQPAPQAGLIPSWVTYSGPSLVELWRSLWMEISHHLRHLFPFLAPVTEKSLLPNPLSVSHIAACDCCFLFLCCAGRSQGLASLDGVNIETQQVDLPLAFSTQKLRSLSCPLEATCSTPLSILVTISWIYSSLLFSFPNWGSPGGHRTPETPASEK